jgi:hypothetical protein
MKLGRLTPVKLQDCFPHEAHHFTPWLAKAENLEELGRAVDLDLELEGIEVSVGPYYADILATDGNTKVVIENQYSRTDHDHLGKMLTYAAGLQAQVAIWIAERFTEEHRQAVDYLNEVTTDDFRVYGIEMRLFRIGDSPPAPQFQVVCRPNDYLRSVNSARSNAAITDTQSLYLEFWTAWRNHTLAQTSRIRPQKPQPQHWTSLAIGRSHFSMELTISTQKRRIGCEIYLRGKLANDAFRGLLAQRESIEAITGDLDWRPLHNKQTCRIIRYQNDIDVTSQNTWPSAHAWLLAQALSFNKAFRSRIKALVLPLPPSEE